MTDRLPIRALDTTGADATNTTPRYNPVADRLEFSPAGTSGGGSLAVEDEGAEIVAAATRLNFTGAGATVTDAGLGEVTVNIPGGGSGGGGSDGSIDDPTAWPADLGYDAEFSTAGTTLPTGWAWVNQGPTTFEKKYKVAVLADASATAANNLRVIERPIPTEAAWAASGKILVRPDDANYWGAGLTLRDAATNKMIMWGPSYNGGWKLNLSEWTGPTGTSTNPLFTVDATAYYYLYWRIRKNSATSWDFELSTNGILWAKKVTARNITTFLANPSHIGFGLWRNGRAVEGALGWFRVR